MQTSTSDPPKSQASGRSGPRTRMGCLTCRRRKVRCDQSTAPPEARSRCGNCVRLELECHYAPPGAQRKPPRRTGGAHASAVATTTMPPQQSQTVPSSNGPYLTPVQSSSEDGAGLAPGNTTQPGPQPPGSGYLGGQDASPDQIQFDRVFGDLPDLSTFSGDQEWLPSYPPGVMSPLNGIFSSSLLPWKDFSQGSDVAEGICNPDALANQAQELRPGSVLPDLPRRLSAPAAWASASRFACDRTPRAPIGTDLALLDVTERQRQLLLHFTPKANPIPLITPTESQWKSAYSSLITMGCGCSFLINAICAVSELNLAASKRGSVEQASAYYRSAASKAEALLGLPSAQVDDRSLKQAFATLFLLMNAEIMAQPLGGQSWPTVYLRTAHRYLKRHNERLRLWSGIGSRILSWIQIVDSKAVYSAGMEKETDRPSPGAHTDAHSSPNGTTTDTVSAARGSPAPSHSAHQPHDAPFLASDSFPTAGEKPSTAPLDEPLSAAEIAYDALYQPAYNFFLHCQGFIPRIIALDMHHRPRGPLDAELEVLQIGQRLRTEIRDLWNKRPQVLGVLTDTDGLHDILHPRVTRMIIQSFRSFVANFHAIRILLHRVAFIHYPASDDVKESICEILRLSREQIADESRDSHGFTTGTGLPNTAQGVSGHVEQQGNGSNAGLPENQRRETGGLNDSAEIRNSEGTNEESTQWKEGTSQAAGGLHPAMLWLWPLFMCGTECAVDERRWLIERMYAMNSTNAERTAVLLAEVTKKQDETNKRVDQRSIRQKIFSDEFDVVY